MRSRKEARSPGFADLARRALLRERDRTLRWLATDNLSELREFHSTLEDFIEREEKREVDALTPHATGGEFWADHYPYRWQQIIGHQLRQAFVVSLASASEFHLGLLCRQVAAITRSPIAVDDLKGGLIARVQKYLGAFAHFSAPAVQDWQWLGDLYLLRNHIVHEAASLDSDRGQQRLPAFIRRSPGISVPSSGYLRIERGFCAFALERVEGLFGVLHEQYASLCSRTSEHEPGTPAVVDDVASSPSRARD